MTGWAVAVLGALVPTSAAAQDGPIAWNAACGEPAAFVATVVGLGGSFEGVDVAVEVVATAGGRFGGRLTIRRGEQTVEVREIEDLRCEDVVDALAIGCALALRRLAGETESGAETESEAESESVAVAESESESGAVAVAVAESESGAVAESESGAESGAEGGRGAVGAGVRGGVGPTPGVAVAPGILGALQLDRLWAAFSISWWPASGTTLEADPRGVEVWAIGATLEVGYRLGDGVSVVPCAVVEPSVASARGTGIERPRTRATFILDAGLALSIAVDLPFGDDDPPVRLFARGDLLFGLARPTYGVEAEVVFASPPIRGTGGAGVLVFF